VQGLRRILYLERHPGGFARSFACALQVARDHGASLTLARGAAESDGIRRAARDRRERRMLEERTRAARAQGVRARVAELDAELMDISSEHDLLMTVARRDSLRWPLRFAPSERSLLQRCRCPTWILHPAQGPRVHVIVAGIDVSSDGEEARNRRVLDTAACLARGAGAVLYVVHAWSLLGESILRSPNRGGSRRTVRRLLIDTAASRRERLERLLDEAAIDPPPRILLRKGRTVHSLESVAWTIQADLVVVGTSGRDGLGTLLVPTAAEQLLGRVPGSVVTVHADVEAGQRTEARASA
jgi:nucleotide-binding universal stress UspA family protein